jgi:ribonuclease P protein component
VLRAGTRVRTKPFDVFALGSGGDHPRIAVIVPLYGHTAVARNRVRRRLREALRTGWLRATHAQGRGVDLVVRAKPAAYEASYGSLRAALDRALESACEP